MCLGVPGKIMERWLDSKSEVPMARVDFGGIGKEICLAFEPDAQIDDYVMVHVGFAIGRIDEDEAMQTLALLQEMSDLADELALAPEAEGASREISG